MSKPSMRTSNHFNDHPKATDHMGGALDERGRVGSIRKAWNSVNGELTSHQNQGITVQPMQRAKIADRLKRDHHRSERTSGQTRGIIKGRVG